MSELTHNDVFTRDEWLNWSKLTDGIYDIAVGRMTNQGDSIVVERRTDGAYYVSSNFAKIAVAINEDYALSKANEAALLNGLWIQPEIKHVDCDCWDAEDRPVVANDVVKEAIACELDITGWKICHIQNQHIALKRLTIDGEVASLWVNHLGKTGHGLSDSEYNTGIVTGSVIDSYNAVNAWAERHGGWA